MCLLAGVGVTAFKTLTFVNSVSTAGLGDNIRSIVTAPGPSESPSSSAAGKQQPSRVNILLLGYGGVGHDGSYLTDSIMVLSLDQQTKKAAMISVPRDIWVRIPAAPDGSGGFFKLNTAYAIGIDDDSFPNKKPEYKSAVGGGGNLASNVVGGILGMKIDYWIAVDFHAFKSMVDALGGVDVDVEKTFTDYEYPRNDDPNVDPGWMTVHFNAGVQHMTGEKAIEYARSRHSLEDGTDFGRSRRQQRLLLAIKDKAVTPQGLSKGFGLMDALSKDFKTNMNLGQMHSLADAAKDVDPAAIERVSIDDTNYLIDAATSDGQDVLVPQSKSWAPLRNYVGSLFLDPAVKAEAAKIQLWNGGGSTGAAGTATTMLNDLGLLTLPPRNVDNGSIQQSEVHDFSQGKDASTVTYLAGLFSAKVVTDEPTPADQADIKIVLGKSYQPATPAADSFDPTVRPFGAYTVPAPAPAVLRPAANGASAAPAASASALAQARPAPDSSTAAATTATPKASVRAVSSTAPTASTAASQKATLTTGSASVAGSGTAANSPAASGSTSSAAARASSASPSGTLAGQASAKPTVVATPAKH
jgi:polyisoprenyl-teichoic acid--peptidoglycan teichoic acid transferase